MQRISGFFKRTVILWVILLYAILTIWMTFPLVSHMTDSVIGRIGDNIHFIWRLGWVKKALFELHTNPFNVWFLNYPEGWNMAYTEITAAQILMGLPFTFIAGPTFAYNIVLMLTFVLSALGMYLWVYRLSRNRFAAFIAGTAFAFSPYRMAHFLVGHYDLSGTQWLPLYFYGFFELLVPQKTSQESGKITIDWKHILLAAVGLGLTGLCSQYYLYMTLLISAFTGALHLLIRHIPLPIASSFKTKFLARLRSFWDVRLWLNLALMGLVSLPLLAAAVAPFFNLNQQGGLPDRDLGMVRLYSASPTDFILPSTDHFLFGKWIGDHFNRDLWNESTLYLGVVCLVLAAIAWFKRRQTGHQHLMVLLLWGVVFALVMAMGTDLHWNERAVEITLPGFLQSLLHRTTTPVVLPAYFFFRYFPFFAKLRALMRFGLFAEMFICVAAGLGTAWILERFNGKKVKTILAIGILGLILFDFYPGPYNEFATISPRPVDAWLAEQPGDGAVVQMPFVKSEDQEQTYFTLYNGKPFVGGFFNAFPPPQYQRIKPLLETFPDPSSIAVLRSLGVQYVLVDVTEYPDPEQTRRETEALGLSFRGQFGDQMVFEINLQQTRSVCPCDQ